MSPLNSQRQIGGLDMATVRAELQRWPATSAPISRYEYGQRLHRARLLMRELGIDAVLITAGASLRYFTGIAWGASERLVGLLITARGNPIVICPTFEVGSLQCVLRIEADLRLWEEHESPHALVVQALQERFAGNLALDPTAAYTVATRLVDALGERRLTDASAIIDGCRMRKSVAELALMQQATAMTLYVQRLAAAVLHEGISNHELVRFIDDGHRTLGADNGSTFCIVQFGQATAYPHGIPGEQRLQRDDLVLIDTGCAVQGYNSDITRCYAFGLPDAQQAKIWSLEQAAQRAAFEAVRPGVTCEAVDAAARAVIERVGLGPDYRLPGIPHRTGHGCGLSIHETPYLVRGNRTVLQSGMCCSNEPMIVVPDHFGIRLEDHFHVTEDGAAWFTEPSPAFDQPFA
ncbi:Xaa-Pro peptidase family protein [Rhodanobacter sp. AS-Z3]|uniref:M24 family metallopeptidase n=1 Tax=Rhodanobacter sp. AS-Z3 TaxID=3031330 RepID=UPI00247AFB83|nr:Xaa-Pro peptidase family protein [Rhodanobacter sp. AS-Z3]WEN15032.1 Xaa-Pro peptidase family protein [Rhodanobacter sp. AS-Z3]